MEASEKIATSFLGNIKKTITDLLYSPFIGVKRDSFYPGLRVIFHKNYAIYYLPTEQEIIIFRIVHGSRDAKAISEQDGF